MIGSAGIEEASRSRAAARWVPLVLAAVCLIYFADPNPRLDLSAFDTVDAESYLALSRALISGLGYTRNLDPHYYVPHVVMPPGLPLLLAPFTWLAGLPINLLVVKLGMIFYGVLGIALAYVYARRVSRVPLTQLLMPLLLALDPYYWQFSRMTDSEVPTVMWSLVALLVVERVWTARRVGAGAAAASGLVCGLGMLIRGSFYGAVLLPLAYLCLGRKEVAPRGGLLRRYLVFGIAFVLPFAAWLARNSFIDARPLGFDGINQLAMILRTAPTDPTSPLRSLSQILSGMLANAEGSAIYQIPRTVIPGLWSDPAWGQLGAFAAPFAWTVTAAALILSCSTLRTLPIVTLYATMALLNLVYASGMLARLWVPVTCLVLLSLPLALEQHARRFSPGFKRGLTAFLVAVMAVNLGFYARAHDARPYHDPVHAALADLFAVVRGRQGLTGNVLTPHPQSFTLYTGANAPMSVPALGIEPVYQYMILPTPEWRAQRIAGRVIVDNPMWSLVALETPMRLSQIRAQYDCSESSIAAFAALSGCLLR